jgi:hypothetical protein
MLKELFDFHNPIVCISWGTVLLTALTVIAKIIYLYLSKEEE